VNPSIGLQICAVILVFVNAVTWYGLLAFIFSRKSAQSIYSHHSRLIGRSAAVVLSTLGLRFLWTSLLEIRSAVGAHAPQ
jgi:threonine/homoserine/homoserine lactone efflux protein